MTLCVSFDTLIFLLFLFQKFSRDILTNAAACENIYTLLLSEYNSGFSFIYHLETIVYIHILTKRIPSFFCCEMNKLFIFRPLWILRLLNRKYYLVKYCSHLLYRCIYKHLYADWKIFCLLLLSCFLIFFFIILISKNWTQLRDVDYRGEKNKR